MGVSKGDARSLDYSSHKQWLFSGNESSKVDQIYSRRRCAILRPTVDVVGCRRSHGLAYGPPYDLEDLV